MLASESNSRAVIESWVRQLLEGMTYPGPDRTYLDELTASEVADLAYIDGVEIAEAIAAHALFTPDVSVDDAQIGWGATSSMEVVFPIHITDPEWKYSLDFKAARPSLIGIGLQNRFPIAQFKDAPPREFLHPRIGGVSYNRISMGEQRLRAISGPLTTIERTWSDNTSRVFDIELPGERVFYGYVDDNGQVQTQPSKNGLTPLAHFPQKPPSFSLQLEHKSCKVRIHVLLTQTQPDQARMKVVIQLLTTLSAGRAQTSDTSTRRQKRERDRVLHALILPHIIITLQGAEAVFPSQQYADTKQRFLQLDDIDRRQEASDRLYAVRQSGCIATRHPANPYQVTISSFGVFDTPREIPLKGPAIAELINSPSELLQHVPNNSSELKLFVEQNWDVVRAILLAASYTFKVEHLHQFQWDAIYTGLLLEATGKQRVATIVRAPTGAGKTVVFMVNAAISALCGTNRSTSILLFPTRLLNEDMFRRLTTFIFHLRTYLSELRITGGLLLGTDDPLYRLTLEPQLGEVVHQFGRCPQCNQFELIAQLLPGTTRLIPTCTKCGHIVDYMYNPRETPSFLPDIIIATPDKLFAEATTNSYIWGRYGLFGAGIRRCNTCGRAQIANWFVLKPSVRCQDVYKQAKCPGQFENVITNKPIRYMGFDEVHSLHGQTVTYLSVFLATLELIQRTLTGDRTFAVRYETATATIANERELLEAITRRHDDKEEIISIPETNQIGKYFTVSLDRVRHRVLLTMPTHVTSRSAMIRALLNAYNNLHGPSKLLHRRLQSSVASPDSWNFIMGYVLKIDDGLDFRRAVIDYYQNARNATLAVEFLSGFSPKAQVSRLIDLARRGAIDILLANLVVSLGIDIHDLNHMIMFGVPRGFTEYVQTAEGSWIMAQFVRS